MSFFESVIDALGSQVHEKAIRQGIDDLGNVRGRIVVLESVRMMNMGKHGPLTCLFTPVQGGCNRTPVPVSGGRVCESG
jgi:hypothetical protein